MRAFITTLCLAAALPAAAQSTLTVLSSNATNALIHELQPAIEIAAGVQLHVEFDSSTALCSPLVNGRNSTNGTRTMRSRSRHLGWC